MIQVTRLDNSSILVNAEIIQYLQSTPDTVITLTTGDKMIVKETPEEVSKRICEYQRSIHSNPLIEPRIWGILDSSKGFTPPSTPLT
jgi:flagellar protein FlbD